MTDENDKYEKLGLSKEEYDELEAALIDTAAIDGVEPTTPEEFIEWANQALEDDAGIDLSSVTEQMLKTGEAKIVASDTPETDEQSKSGLKR